MRHPPLLGATGVDFGFKPAISIVLPRKKREPLLGEESDDADCDPPTPHFALLIVTISGAITGYAESASPDVNSIRECCRFLALTGDGEASCVTPTEVGNPGPVPFQGEADLVFHSDEGCGFGSPPTDEWTLSLGTLDLTGLGCEIDAPCPQYGGEQIYTVNLGSDPIGTHVIDFDDPNCPAVHYQFTITFS